MNPNYPEINIIEAWLEEIGYTKLGFITFYKLPSQNRSFIRDSLDSIVVSITPVVHKIAIYRTHTMRPMEVKIGYMNTPVSADLSINLYDPECFNRIQAELGI